jgi:hypothetical protein
MEKKRILVLVLLLLGMLYISTLTYDAIDYTLGVYSEETTFDNTSDNETDVSPEERIKQKIEDDIFNNITAYLPFVFALSLTFYVFYLLLKELVKSTSSTKKSRYIDY